MLTADRVTTSGRTVRRPGRFLAAALAVLLLGTLATPSGAAGAAGPGGNCPPGQQDCNVWDTDPGTPGGGGDSGGGNGGGGNGGGGSARCEWNGRPLACYHPMLGYFNNGDGCYYQLSKPQKDAPPGKKWYTATCNGGDLGSIHEVLLDAPPAGFEAPPDPEELARRALASITLRPPVLQIAPRKSVGPGLVGLPVWLWISPGEGYWGPLGASASERGLTVAITAAVDRIVWTMGNGEKVECRDPGTPYDPRGSRAGKPSPDCGYDGYPRPGTYQVGATTHWTVDWEASSGASGTIAGVNRIGDEVAVQINELQVVTE